MSVFVDFSYSVAMAELSWGNNYLIAVTEKDVLEGVKFIDCSNCCGCGLICWTPEIEECVLCKGTGRYPVGL